MIPNCKTGHILGTMGSITYSHETINNTTEARSILDTGIKNSTH